MSRSLDIAKILRATEIDNTTNNPLITNTNQLGGGMDSSAVQSVPMQYYGTLDSLPMTNLSIGLQAFVEENRRHYVSNGSGWYNTGYSIGASPYWDSDPLSTYEIVDSATPLIVIAKPQDSDTANFVNQSFGSDSAQYMATITNDSSVFTFTPKTKVEIGNAVAAGNLTDSDGDFVYTFKWSDGINFISKEVTITYNATGFIVLPFVNGGDRGFVFAGRKWPASYNSTTGSNNVSYVGIQYFNTTSPGNASSFGNLNAGSVNEDAYPGSSNSWCDNAAGNMSNGTRALFGAGNNYQSLTNNDYIQYITCATFSSVAIFGQLTRGGYGKGGTSDGIKALMSDGGNRRQIDYVTIDTTGNASDFGDMQSYSSRGAGFSDGVKCVWNVGQSASYGYEYVTAATLSNATTFGYAVQSRYDASCAHGNTTYGMTMGGDTNGSTAISSVEYIVFQTLGNATNWGSSLPQTRKNNAGCGNSNTAFSCGGEDASGNGYLNNIYAISMDVVGNSASDFGDLAVNHQSGVGNSGNAA
tara:strand:- start:1583 stop:3163 length:1581 start_codon:yes stop_codon:yes gene_type:complete